MPNQKISELSAITLIDDADVLPIVDSIAIETKKISVTQIKGLAPVQSVNGSTGSVSVQPTLESGTNIKTINSTTVLGSGDIAVQETLVSGTNIKTINSTSLLGSGDIVIAGGSPSGVSGAIQFSDGSAFASDAANLFWDDTNDRLGIGTNTPSALLNVQNSSNGVLLARFKDNISATTYLDIKADPTLTDYTALYFGSDRRIMSKQGSPLFITCNNNINFVDGLASKMTVTPTEVQIGSISGARLGIKGSGTTSATTSLLVQNSAGSNALQVRDDRVIICAGMPTSSAGLPSGALYSDGGTIKIV